MCSEAKRQGWSEYAECLLFHAVIYQTREIVFHHISRQREDNLTYGVQRNICDGLRNVMKD